ncbi:MAG TPA: hypothetical protein VHE35_22455 [Kofleriaceae bacterium]|nr:hypothetical protein [Kofleriaceae bacterium]
MRAPDRALVTAAAAMAFALASAAPGARRAAAEIDGDQLVAPERGLRLELPRGWRASEVSAYPGIVVWLSRTQPHVTLLVTVDPVVGPCRDPLRFCDADPDAAINVLRQQLLAAGFQITAQEASRVPELDYQAGDRYLRHAVLVEGNQVVSVILAADSPALRAAQARVFERLALSIRALAPAPRRPAEDEREIAPP